MLSEKLEIVVVGGSLAALMASIPLARLGHNLTILERSSTPLLHNQGAGVVAGGETQAFYKKHDLSGRQIAVTSLQRLYLDKKGEIIDQEGSTQRMTSWDLLYYLGRANFDQVDSEYLDGSKAPPKPEGQGKSRYEYGRVVTKVRDLGNKVEVSYNDTRDREGASSGGSQSGTIQADFLIAADGPSSQLRQTLLPSISKRSYAGYVAFRGTVPEAEISSDAAKVFIEKFTFYHSTGTQILAYTIPGPAGALEKGKRMINWVWYCNYEADSKAYEELMTDTDGNLHRFTLPTGGKMRPEVWENQKQVANYVLPPQFAEMVAKTTMPFVQAITDLPPPEEGTEVARLMKGKAILVGDALAGFRPHTAASTSQAAFHALLLERAFKGDMTWKEYEEEVLHFANSWQRRGVLLGTRSQFGHHPLEGDQMAPVDGVPRSQLHLRE